MTHAHAKVQSVQNRVETDAQTYDGGDFITTRANAVVKFVPNRLSKHLFSRAFVAFLLHHSNCCATVSLIMRK